MAVWKQCDSVNSCREYSLQLPSTLHSLIVRLCLLFSCMTDSFAVFFFFWSILPALLPHSVVFVCSWHLFFSARKLLINSLHYLSSTKQTDWLVNVVQHLLAKYPDISLKSQLGGERGYRYLYLHLSNQLDYLYSYPYFDQKLPYLLFIQKEQKKQKQNSLGI